MPYAFAQIAFTPAVRSEQARRGSADAYAKALSPLRDGGRQLTEREAAFLEARDGFYQATVSETGWPYVQFRGGRPGFLRVLDAQTLGYADYRGNRQYISTGNLHGDPRVSIIAMDYPNRQRLKLWGRVTLSEEPDMIEALQISNGPRAERAVLIGIEAFDWNCPQHIPQRRTDAEQGEELARLQARIEALEAQLARSDAGQH